MAVTGTTLRRNIHGDIKIDGKVVKRGDFLAYCIGDVHLNPDYYPEPYKYDSGRWLRPDPVSGAAYPFIGWGCTLVQTGGSKKLRLSRTEMTFTRCVGLSPGYSTETAQLSLSRLALLELHATSTSGKSWNRRIGPSSPPRGSPRI